MMKEKVINKYKTLKRLQEGNEDYKSRIEKAIEYIKEHIQKYDIDGSIGDFDEFDMLTKPNYLLNILQNGSDEE